MTKACNSSENAWREVDKMLAAMAQHANTKRQMIKAQKSEVWKDQMGGTEKR